MGVFMSLVCRLGLDENHRSTPPVFVPRPLGSASRGVYGSGGFGVLVGFSFI